MDIHRPEIIDGVTDYMSYIQILDEKSAGSDGGTFTAGAWRTRTLNTIKHDDTGEVTLSSNQFVLPAGTYLADIAVPGSAVQFHRAILYNITDSEQTLYGRHGGNFSSIGGNVESAYVTRQSFIHGTFTITASKTFEIRNWGQYTIGTWGFGRPQGNEVEIYTNVQLWKIK